MAFATSADLVNHYDARLIGDCASDDGIRVPNGALASNGKITEALSYASGRILAALQIGGRYAAADLTALTGDSLAYLKGMTCDIAMAKLIRRRGWGSKEEFSDVMEKAEEHLELLRKGSNIFDSDDHEEAGKIDGEVGPTAVDLSSSHLIRYRTRRYYPAIRTPGNR